MTTSPIRVMIVDDSSITRGLFANLLESNPEFKVVATAANGAIAVNTLRRSGNDKIDVDVIILDLMMPEMDGLTAIPKLLEASPSSSIIVVTALTEERAKDTMRALSLGASDYLVKPSSRDNREVFYRELTDKVRNLGKRRRKLDRQITKSGQSYQQIIEASQGQAHQAMLHPARPTKYTLRKKSFVKKPDALAIGSSTGGPQALVNIFSALKGRKIYIPIFITQHMPPKFTSLLAKQISDVSGLKCEEAFDGEVVNARRVYLAPGDYHMTVKKEGNEIVLHLDQNTPENFCRPAVDPMLRSLSDTYGEKLLVTMLTGMGSDGMLGSRMVVEKGGSVIAQDEETSIVWGMPGAVATDGLCVNVLPLNVIVPELIELSQGQIQ